MSVRERMLESVYGIDELSAGTVMNAERAAELRGNAYSWASDAGARRAELPFTDRDFERKYRKSRRNAAMTSFELSKQPIDYPDGQRPAGKVTRRHAKSAIQDMNVIRGRAGHRVNLGAVMDGRQSTYPEELDESMPLANRLLEMYMELDELSQYDVANLRNYIPKDGVEDDADSDPDFEAKFGHLYNDKDDDDDDDDDEGDADKYSHTRAKKRWNDHATHVQQRSEKNGKPLSKEDLESHLAKQKKYLLKRSAMARDDLGDYKPLEKDAKIGAENELSGKNQQKVRTEVDYQMAKGLDTPFVSHITPPHLRDDKTEYTCSDEFRKAYDREHPDKPLRNPFMTHAQRYADTTQRVKDKAQDLRNREIERQIANVKRREFAKEKARIDGNPEAKENRKYGDYRSPVGRNLPVKLDPPDAR